MRQSRKIRTTATPTFAFVVDGATEVWYLQMLKRNERHLRINIKPEIPTKKSITDQYKLVKDLLDKEYTKVYWLVDLDNILKESREAPRGRKTSLQIFNEYRQVLLNNHDNVEVLVNNPCLEFWFLVHFINSSKNLSSCTKAEKELKKHLPGYEKTQRFFTRQDHDIYTKLKPLLPAAIKHASQLGTFDQREQQRAVCEMYQLFSTSELQGIPR
jgi:hypothetical protein